MAFKFEAQRSTPARTFAAGDLGRGHRDGVRQALRIQSNVPLDARACTMVFSAGRVALCVSTVKYVLQALRPCFTRAAPT